MERSRPRKPSPVRTRTRRAARPRRGEKTSITLSSPRFRWAGGGASSSSSPIVGCSPRATEEERGLWPSLADFGRLFDGTLCAGHGFVEILRAGLLHPIG